MEKKLVYNYEYGDEILLGAHITMWKCEATDREPMIYTIEAEFWSFDKIAIPNVNTNTLDIDIKKCTRVETYDFHEMLHVKYVVTCTAKCNPPPETFRNIFDQ